MVMHLGISLSEDTIANISQGVVFKGPVYGAFTELYAGFSSEIQSEQNGCYIIPWGRLGSVPEHMASSMLSKEQGGTGLSTKFWDWCEMTTASYH